MSKITAYSAITNVQPDDELVVVDVHDTSMAATGTDKKMTLAQLWGSLYTSSAAAEPLNSGEAIFPRYLSAASSWTPVSGTTYLTYWAAASSGTCSQVTTYTGVTAAAGLTYASIGVYSVAPSTGNLTLLASTGDIHSTAWLAANTAYTNSWAGSATFSRVAGNVYALALLILGNGGTMPVISGYTGIASQLALPSLAVPQVTATVASLECNSAGQISTIASWAAPSPGVLSTMSSPASAGFPTSGTILVVASGNTYAVVTYTGLTSSSFTGCAYVSGSPTGNVFAFGGIYPSTGFLPVSGSAVSAGANATAAVVAP